MAISRVTNGNIISCNNKIQNGTFVSRGNGLKFDGVNDYTITNSSIPITTETNSISMIFELKNVSNDVFFVNEETGGGGIFCYIYLSKIIVQRGRSAGSGVTVYTVALSNNIVYHLCFIYNGDLTNDLYINGVLQTKFSATNIGSAIKTTTLKIGKTQPGGNTYFNGIVYDFKLFTKVLTQTEVTILYNSNCSVVPNSAISSLLINYNFNEKQGTTLIDKTSNLYNSTLTNYTAGDTTLGSGNKWVDENGNPILS